MNFNWQELVRRFCTRSIRKSAGMSGSKRRARRRLDSLTSAEQLETRIVLTTAPTLTVILGSQSISEASVGSGVTAIVQREGVDLSSSVTVTLLSSDTTEATVPSSVVIPAGASSASFTVTPVDDNLLDGSQTAKITAYASGYTYASVVDSGPVGLDTTFGTGGYSTAALNWSLSNVVPDLLIQSNGAIVSISQTPGSATSWTLVRKNSVGAADTTFNGTGAVATNFTNATMASPTALALQSDGKIIAVGIVGQGSFSGDDIAIVRYNVNGTLDTTFGTGGIRRIERSGHHMDTYDVTVLADGSIVVAGGADDGSFIAKVSSTGVLDSNFGTNGLVITPIPGSDYSFVKSVVVQSDGKILVGGYSVQSNPGTALLSFARYQSNGTLDTSFDVDGMVQVDSNSAESTYGDVRKIALQSDGKLVFVGTDQNLVSGNDDWVIGRLNANGSLDTTFSSDGLTTLDFTGKADIGNSLVIQPDGKLVVMGGAFVAPNGTDLAVARFNTDGSLDTSLNGTGKLVLPAWSGTTFERIWAGQLNSSGQLVFLAGYNTDMRVGRLNLGVALPARDVLTVTDYETLSVSISTTSVAENAGAAVATGTVTRGNIGDLSQALTVSLQSSDTSEATVPVSVVIPAGATSATFSISAVDDNLLDGSQTAQITASATGFIYTSTPPSPPAGLDTTFGTSGYSTTPLAWSLSNVFPDLLIQPNGAIVSIGQVSGADTSWRLTRKTASGAADSTFGTAGIVTTAFSNSTTASPTALALQSDGKILAVGILDGGTSPFWDLVVVRYNADGSVDTTFASAGILRIEGSDHYAIYDVKVLADGSILLAGAKTNDSFLVKLSPSGVLDNSFGTNGFVTTTIPGSQYSSFKSVSVQSDGKIIAAGTATFNSAGNTSVFSVARYLANGTIDTSYDADGMQQIDTNPNALTYGVVRSAALQADGKLVLVGVDQDTVAANDNWAIVRLNASGSLDTTFSGDGLATVDFNGSADVANDFAIQSDGKLLVMGAAFVPGTGHDLGVARFNTDGTLDPTFDADGKLILPNWSGTIWEQILAGKLNASGQLVFLAGYNTDIRVGKLNVNPTPLAGDSLTVTDYETLTVSIVPTSVAEYAGPSAVTGTVTRSNTGDLSSPLIVSLFSSDTSELTVPTTVTIPAGQASVTFAINAIDDNLVDGTQTVVISASAAGYISVSDTLLVTDNSAPVVQPRSFPATEDTVLNGVLTGTDADGNALTFSVFSSPAHGQLTLNANGGFVYTPAANYFGTDSFRYRAYDGKVFSNVGIVTISIQGVNDAPVANADSYVVDEDKVLVTAAVAQSAVHIQMSSDPGDWIGGGSTYDFTGQNGAVTAIASPSQNVVRLVYQSAIDSLDHWDFEFSSPNTNTPLSVGTYTGATRYPFNPAGTPGLDVSGRGRGSNGLTGTFTIQAISFKASGELLSFYATFEQHSEAAVPALHGTIVYDTSLDLAGGVLANDTDVDGNVLSAALVTGPAHGNVVLNSNGSFQYTPSPNYYGPDSFTYKASDGTLQSAEKTVSLTVNSVEDPPSIQNQSFSVLERSPNGTVVGNLVASDDDPGQTLSYALTTTSIPGALAIDALTGQISVLNGTLLNYRQATSITMTVTATDSGNPSLSSTATVVIAVDSANVAPVITTTTLGVNENAVNGTVVGKVLASDVDAGQKVTFAISAGNTGNAFTIDPVTGIVKVSNSAALDFETAPAIALTITATDDGAPPRSSSRTVTVNLNDVNDSPLFPAVSPTLSIAENSVAGTVVGQNNANDQDAGQLLTYAITAGNTNNAFSIDNTGTIRVANPAVLNFEVLKSITLTITATDNGSPVKVATTRVTITVTDVNETPAVTPATFNVNENSVNGSFVGTVIAIDPDVGQVRSFAITDGNTNNTFVIDSKSGQLKVNNGAMLDFETASPFVLTITATDNGTPALSSSGQITINVKDVNDAPVFASSTASFTVAENSPVDTLVGQNAATDQDPGQVVSYAIAAGNTNNAFAIDNTGKIRVANPAALNFELVKVFTLTITATDNGTPTKVATTRVSIALTDVNEVPVVTPSTFNVNENSANGSFVGTVLVIDPDAGQARTFAIANGNTNNAFVIDSKTGQLKVNNAAMLDFETASPFVLTITATDNGTPALSSSGQITINVKDVNDAPVFASSTASFTVAENSPVDTLVGQNAATDQDPGQVVSYAIAAGNTNNAFAIDNTGKIRVANPAALNFELVKVFTLTITATDNGTPAKVGTTKVSIAVSNVNESPVVTPGTFSLNENSPNGAYFGTVIATDPDAGQVRSFAITSGNTNNAFVIDSATGQLRVNNATAINFESQTTYLLTVTATDNGTPALSASGLITINVNDVNDLPVFASTTASFTIAENSPIGTLVGQNNASDQDAGQTVAYAITAGNINGAFSIDNAGTIRVANPAALNFESLKSFKLTISATDNGSPAKVATTSVAIAVTDVNEAPVVTSTTLTINENFPSGVAFGNVVATDPDAGQTRTFAITGGNTNNAFTIDPATGQLKVSNSAALDFETTPQFSLTITVTDNATVPKSGSGVVTVKLLNLNEAPVIAPQSLAVKTRSTADTVVGTVVASDPDVGQTLTFAIVLGNGTAPNDYFTIDPVTGVIKVKSAASVSTDKVYNLTVRVTDNGAQVRTAQANVRIYVNATGIVPAGV